MVYVHQEVSQVVTRKGASGTHPTLLGGVTARRIAFGGEKPKFDNLKIGYDNNSDDDIDDVGDDVVISESFDSSSRSISYDHAGNLIDDGRHVFVYDAWNRLVKSRASLDADVTVQTAEFFADGRRAAKTVSNSGEYDATEVYLYNGQKIIETRDGSNNVTRQFVHGTQYIDELIMMRAKNKGDLYVHQDANWNVIALTDLARNVVERYVYTPYGEVVVHQEDGFGDRDGDDDVDSTDKGTVGTTCTGTVTGECRILDLGFDGDYDSADATLFDSLPQGIARHPGKFASGVDQPFHHQGLYYEPELNQYQNRARQYLPEMKRFAQRDPLFHLIPLEITKNLVRHDYLYERNRPFNSLDPLGLDDGLQIRCIDDTCTPPLGRHPDLPPRPRPAPPVPAPPPVPSPCALVMAQGLSNCKQSDCMECCDKGGCLPFPGFPCQPNPHGLEGCYTWCVDNCPRF